jgi:hypothetical protein
MLKNITLSADETLIRRARDRAAAQNTSLNDEFRRWLEKYVEQPKNAAEFLKLMEELEYAKPGKTFTRQEMNER